ncbi:uncharacterized protein LOC133300871 [Gastrolobium bilobum]|uniref:uncharacterized protein LOC133300871 n=1 Tax=Gastrolobium bilobum TaxID=150636 RepID=UPI002AAFE7BF|nr:uncharacterized protein LOC133300871 [Gastrolobium bilobum]
MPRKKRQFRFRIPWISCPFTGSQSRRPKSTSQIPIQRPPFRPPGIASVPPQPLPSQAQGTVERKMMFATTSNARGEEIKVVSSASADSVTRNVSSSISNDEKPPQQKGMKDDDILNLVHPTQPMDDKTVSVVTLAGDNRGATMHVTGSHSARKNEENSPSTSTEKDEVGKAYVNSNIQSMNNSLLLHGSITERDPGVSVILPQRPAEPIKPRLENQKAEVNINRTERLTHRPMIRRRCLRGLLMEPSDSDPDNPRKPRRHGCKFSCGDIRKD